MNRHEEDYAITHLREEALTAQDFTQARLCEIALGDVTSPFTSRLEAREHCLKAIADAKTQND